MNKICIATTAIDSSRLRKHVAHSETVRWIFLARDYRLMRRLARELGKKFAAVIITDILSQVADEIRTEHIEWIDRLNRANGGQSIWWFGAVSSRNVHSSNLFLYSCYLLVLQRVWQNPDTRPDLIVVDSPGLAECIEFWIKTNNADISVRRVSSKKMFLRNIRPFLHYVMSVAIFGARYFAALFTRLCLVPKKGDGPQVVVDTFVHNDSLSEQGVFRDRYFPFLHEFLQAEGHQVLVHPVLYGFRYNYVSIFRRMRKSLTSFIIQEDYLQISDYVAALLAPLTLRGIKIQQGHFRGINLDPVIQEEHRLQPSLPVMQSILTYRLWRRLNLSGVALSWVISWYENQVIDKALIAGVRDAYPGIRIVGAQMFIHIPNYLSLYPSQSEQKAGFTPDLMLQTGEGQCKTALKYAHAIPCRAAAALRYAHLYTKQCGTERSATPQDGILVLLPFFMDETLEILDILLDAVQEIPDGTEFLIKCHPDYSSSEEIIDAFGRDHWPKEFRIWDGSLSAAFEKAALVIASNSSSMVEAVVLGIPVIFIKRNSNLNMNPLAGIPSADFVSCFSGPQIARAIARYRALSQEGRNELIKNGLLLRDKYFTHIDDNSLKAFDVADIKQIL
jgi:surface carbohydrate biosynthesis protein (TIGR04326 family)